MSNFAGIELVAVVAAIVLGLYYYFLHKTGILKPATPTATIQTTKQIAILPIIGIDKLADTAMTLPPAIATPVIDFSEIELQMDDESNILLQEAERVVDQIQDTINHIASNPPDQIEVTSKIRSIVIPYQIFLDTEYYDSINTYISLAVERDCSIQLSPDELKALWN
jgi:hypothetical protein